MMNRFHLFKSIFYLLYICSFSCANAQNARIKDQNTNAWFMYFGDHNLTQKWGIHTEAQIRRAEIVETWQQLLLRGGINYNFSKNLMGTLGYAFVQTHPYGDFPVSEAFPEHRIYEQLQFKNKENKVGLLHRYRLEQRWVKPAGKDTFVYTNRVRYMFRAVLPLTKRAAADTGFYLAAYDEVFVNFGKNVQFNIFDQNRLGFALGYKFSKNIALEAGYLNQIIQKANGKILEYNHTLQLGLTYNLDFRKTE
ncbi:MAG: DUF2490 domain-containing protein [Sphingobacteriales bacterium]|nr:MAG: DUF2490 domain-containing protein [Sphingobacteriales bacterium]